MSEGRFALGGLLLVAVWLFVGLPLLYGPPQAPKVQAQQHSDSAVKGEQSPNSEAPAASKPNQHNATNHGEKAEEEGTEFWPPFLGLRLKITDSLLAVFTFGLLIFTGLLWRSTEKLWTAGERQLRLAREALVADQRAWLIATVEIENVTFGVAEDGAADAEIFFSVEIANAGRTPALDVDLSLRVIGNFASEPAAIREHAVASYTSGIYQGRMIHAGKGFTSDHDLTIPAGELYKYGMNGLVTPLIVGCINYRILQDSEIRQTAFGYRPQRAGDDARIFIQEGDLLMRNDMQTIIAVGGFAS
jgi:hypothetical protein